MVSLPGVASARLTNEFLGSIASAYIIDRPLLNGLQPTFALNEPYTYNNDSNELRVNLFLIAIISIILTRL